MKRILALFLVAAATATQAQTPSQELLNHLTFAGLKSEVKADYGTAENPLPSGAFLNIADRSAMQTQMRKLENSYRWPDGSKLDFSKRGSTHGKPGIMDVYTMVKPNSKDTLRLYVDPYHSAESYFVPKGLVALTGPLLAKELAPLVIVAEELYNAPDAATLTESSAQLLSAINKQMGTDFFIDRDAIAPIINDKEADKQLGGYLIRSYLFSKFLAYTKNIKDPKSYARKKMMDNFQKFAALHPEVNSGGLKDTLK
jgi:hypothetical protein